MTEIPPTRLEPIDRDRVERYARAVGDFNPVHFDAAFARAAGLPDTVVHGPLTVALVTDVLVARLGADRLLNLDVRLRAPVFPGDRLTVEGTEYGVAVHKDDGQLVATGVVLARDPDR